MGNADSGTNRRRTQQVAINLRMRFKCRVKANQLLQYFSCRPGDSGEKARSQ